MSVKAGNNPSDNNLIIPAEIKLTGFMAVFAFKDATISLSGLSNENVNTVNEERLKQIIVEKANEIFDTIPADNITEEQILIENKLKTIMFNGQSLSARIAIKNKTDDTLLIDFETIVLSGFKIAIGLKSSNVHLVLDQSEAFLDQYLAGDQQKLKALIYKNRHNIFDNWPDSFDENSVTITNVIIDNKQRGELIVTIKVTDPNNNGSDLISETDLAITGFFDLKNDRLQLQLNYGEEAIYQYVDHSTGTNTEEQKMLLAKLIFNHKEKIFINLPADFMSEQIKIESAFVDSAGTLRINLWTLQANSNDELLNKKEIYLSGFFDFNQVTNLKLTDQEKPKSQYKDPSGGPEKLINLIFKNRTSIFSFLPQGFAADWIKITKPASDGPTNLGNDILGVEFKIVRDGKDLFQTSILSLKGFTN